MDKTQKIYCNVGSCEYNNCETKMCKLNAIKVAACPGCSNGNPEDESMCDSYKCKY